jgi:hypothetical protein
MLARLLRPRVVRSFSSSSVPRRIGPMLSQPRGALSPRRPPAKVADDDEEEEDLDLLSDEKGGFGIGGRGEFHGDIAPPLDLDELDRSSAAAPHAGLGVPASWTLKCAPDAEYVRTDTGERDLESRRQKVLSRLNAAQFLLAVVARDMIEDVALLTSHERAQIYQRIADSVTLEGASIKTLTQVVTLLAAYNATGAALSLHNRLRKWLENDRIKCLDDVYYRALIKNFVNVGANENQIFHFLDHMRQDGVPVAVEHLNPLIKLRIKTRGVVSAISVLDLMGKYGVLPDLASYNQLLYGCSFFGEVDRYKMLLLRMRSQGIQPDMFTLSAVLRMMHRSNAVFADALELYNAVTDGGTNTNAIVEEYMFSLQMTSGDVSGAEERALRSMERFGPSSVTSLRGSMIHEYLSRQDSLPKAVYLASQILPSLSADVQPVVCEAGSGASWTRLCAFLDQHRSAGVLNSVAVTALLRLFMVWDTPETRIRAREFIAQLHRNGGMHASSVYDMIARLYIGWGEVHEALSMLHLPSTGHLLSVSFFNAVVADLVKNPAHFEDLVSVYRVAQRRQLRFSRALYAEIITAAANRRQWDFLKEVAMDHAGYYNRTLPNTNAQLSLIINHRCPIRWDRQFQDLPAIANNER